MANAGPIIETLKLGGGALVGVRNGRNAQQIDGKRLWMEAARVQQGRDRGNYIRRSGRNANGTSSKADDSAAQ